MSKNYDDYLFRHREAVTQAYRWLRDHIPELDGLEEAAMDIFRHDDSKAKDKEYDAYDEYFYGTKIDDPAYQQATNDNFDRAWLHHIHHNEHHWQHWVLMEDSGAVRALPIPDNFIIEMICDWWSFSWTDGDLTKIFSWYEENKHMMVMESDTRLKVEYILGLIKFKLGDESTERRRTRWS